MRIISKFQSASFLRNLTVNVEVLRFLWYVWYVNVLQSSQLLQTLLYVGSRGHRMLKRSMYIFGSTQSHQQRTDQVIISTRIKDIKEEIIQLGSPEKIWQESKMEEGSTMTQLPIIFMHCSNSDYLKYSFAQAKQSNPKATIYLLGDSTNNCYDFVEHYSFLDYFQGAHRFSEIYRHFNTNPFSYEIFNFQRWFILKEFLTANRIKRCLYLDSDTMLYTDVTEENKKFEQFDFTLSFGMSGNTFFLNRAEALDEFCQFLIDIYTKKDQYHYDKIVAHFAARKKNDLPGGACDMTAFQLYSEVHFGAIGEVAQIIDDSVYDPNVNTPHPGFEMDNGIKKILWNNGVFYGIYGRTGREIKFNSLHFQGKAKNLMGHFLSQNKESLSKDM